MMKDDNADDERVIMRLKPRNVVYYQEESSPKPYGSFWNGTVWVRSHPTVTPTMQPSTAPSVVPTTTMQQQQQQAAVLNATATATATRWAWIWPRPSYFGKDGSLEASYSKAWFFALVVWVASLLLPKGIRRKLGWIPSKRYRLSTRNYRPTSIIISSSSSTRSKSSSICSSSFQDTHSSTNTGTNDKASMFKGQTKLQHDYSLHDRQQSGIIQTRSSCLTNSTQVADTNNDNDNDNEEEEEVVFSDVNLSSWSSFVPPETTPPPYSTILIQDDDASSSVVSSSIAPTSTVIPMQYTNNSAAESPMHPDPEFVPPSNIVWKSTLKSLEDPGVRCMAHGVTTETRTVWLQFLPQSQCLTWKTEIASGWGPLHQLALEQILYVDVGPHTPALQNQPSNLCLSLLTRQGSLDLQTRTTMERNALVSCFCILLDRTHGSQRWRHLSHTTVST